MRIIETKDSNQIMLGSVRRRIAEAHQLLRHTDVSVHDAELIRGLLDCTDLAVADLADDRKMRP